jgi:hypothetical protein
MKDIVATYMGGKIISEEKYEMPHGSHSEGVIYNWKVPKGIPPFGEAYKYAKIGIFNYDSDWNWLIPVIEKIENTEISGDFRTYKYRFIIYKNECIIEEYNWDRITYQTYNWHPYIKIEGKNKIKATYDCIVEFLNKQIEINE